MALLEISWKQRISCHVLRIIFGVQCLCSTDLNVFYLSVLKQFVGQYKNMEWCDVLIFKNDFLQATRTICANYSQRNQVLFGENAGKQCVTMSLTARRRSPRRYQVLDFFHFE